MIRISISKKLSMPNSATELVVDAELPLNKITALYGKSGAGKTSFLKILAGLMQPERGYIEINGKIWLNTEKKVNLPPQKREIGFVFQDYALFPNMTVRQNLLYAAGKNADVIQANHLLKLTGLSAFTDHMPATLSGGQKQRAALARALIRKPSLLLLDEPLSAIDNETRQELQQQLLQLHSEYRFTAILVSHDTDEIFRLASQVWCVDNGVITQIGTPVQVFAAKSVNNVLRLTGVIIAIEGDDMSVLIGKQLIMLKNNSGSKVGDHIDVHLSPSAL